MATNETSSYGHGDLKPSDYCTIDTCPLSLANFTYIPMLGGNVAYLAIFAVLLVPNLYIGIKHKTWGYMIGMVCGLALEVIGYAGRLQLHYNPFKFDPFLEYVRCHDHVTIKSMPSDRLRRYLICLTIAPAFLTAAIYLCLARIVVAYGENISRIAPRLYTIVFVTCDFV